MKISYKNTPFAWFYVLIAVAAFLALSWLSFHMRIELMEPRRDASLESIWRTNVFATMHGYLRIAFVLVPIALTVGHFLRHRSSLWLNIIGILLMFSAIICVLVSWFWDFYPSEGEFGGGWVMYPPLSNQEPIGPVFEWVVTSLVLVGLSAFVNIISFLKPHFGNTAQ